MGARVWASAALAGAGFGLAVSVVEVWLNARRILVLGIHPPLALLATGAALGVGLAVAVGVVTAPARAKGAGWHWLAMAAVWIAIQEYAAPDGTAARILALGPPAAALVLGGGGILLARRRRWVPVVLGVLLLAAGLVTPEVNARRRAPVLVPVATGVAPPGAPDVVVVVLDTVRADHVSAYGYLRPTTPNFDALAAGGALFLDAVSPATWSLPSHASLFTGRFVSAHRAHDEHPFLDGDTPTLAETLARDGWDTRSFTANAWIGESLGMVRGFAWTDQAWRRGDVARPFVATYRLLDRLGWDGGDKGGAAVTTTFEAWLAARPQDGRPAFAFLDFVEAQLPYHQLPPDDLSRFTSRPRRELYGLSSQLLMAQFGGDLPAGRDAAELAAAMYDAGVAYADHLLGRVVDALQRRGTLDRTIVVVLADHGELLGDHGEFGHGHSLYEQALHVPLAIRYPPRIPAGVRIATPVSTVGVYATVLDLAGLPPVPSTQVGSLMSVIRGGTQEGPVLSEQYAAMIGSAREGDDDPLLRKSARFRAYRSGRHKLIEAQPGGIWLFDLDADPKEEQDLSMRDRLAVGRMRDEVDGWTEKLGLPDLGAPVTKAPPKAVDPAAR